jgi:hypothetical protein
MVGGGAPALVACVGEVIFAFLKTSLDATTWQPSY